MVHYPKLQLSFHMGFDALYFFAHGLLSYHN